MILYLASTQHTNLLDFTGWYAPDSETPVKKMVGSFILRQFVVRDMRNFSHFTDVVLDRLAFGDDDMEFAQAVEEFLTMYHARITVICEGLTPADPLFQALLDIGVGNLVCATEITAIQREITECLSETGMTRYKPRERPQKEGEKYRFTCENVRIFVVGAQPRIGTTTAAISKYAETQDVLHVIDHPMVVGATDRQHEKITMLREFLNAYQDLRDNEWQGRRLLDGPKAAEDYFRSQLAYYRERETVLCAFMSSSGSTISCEKISQGTVNCSSVFPREVLKRAIQLDACSIILAHNHPGGSAVPSREDIALTTHLHSILKPLGITLCDHIIIADNQAVSMREGQFVPAVWDCVDWNQAEMIAERLEQAPEAEDMER